MTRIHCVARLLMLLLVASQPSIAAPPAAKKPRAQSSAHAASSAAAPAVSIAQTETPTVPTSLGTAESFVLAPGLSVGIRAPAGWTGAASDTSWFKPDEVAGSALAISRTWALDMPDRPVTSSRPIALHLTCVIAPASDWAPGLETLVFERMSTVVKTNLVERLSLDAFEPLLVEEDRLLHRQRFRLRGDMGVRQREGNVSVVEEDKPNAPRLRLSGEGKHIIGFVGTPAKLFACSVLCVIPERSASRICDDSIASMRFDGDLSAEPTPSMWMRLMLSLHKNAWPWIGLMAGLLAVTLGVFCIGRGATLRRPREESKP